MGSRCRDDRARFWVWKGADTPSADDLRASRLATASPKCPNSAEFWRKIALNASNCPKSSQFGRSHDWGAVGSGGAAATRPRASSRVMPPEAAASSVASLVASSVASSVAGRVGAHHHGEGRTALKLRTGVEGVGFFFCSLWESGYESTLPPATAHARGDASRGHSRPRARERWITR